MRNTNAAESFLYIWYDTKNKMYYLGKHKGTPDDSYTHSSTHMESFNKDNIPSYMRRRILAYGTDEEMYLLEQECLKNRKEKKWDQYYNVHTGYSGYCYFVGEDHPSWIDGRSYDAEWNKERAKQWRKDNKKKHSMYFKERRPKYNQYMKEYRSDPERKEKINARRRELYAMRKVG